MKVKLLKLPKSVKSTHKKSLRGLQNLQKFKETFRDTAKEIKIDSNIHFHTLRDSFASRSVQRGVSIYEVSKLYEHSDIIVTEIYAHLKPENLRNAVEIELLN